MKFIKIVIADDSKDVINYLENIILSSHNLKLIGKALDGEEALKIISETKPDLVITDLEMPKLSGLELIEKINKNIPNGPKFIIISGTRNPHTIRNIMNLGIEYFFTKPLNKDEILDCISEIFPD